MLFSDDLFFVFLKYLSIPQGNQLFHHSNLLTDYLKQTVVMETLKTDWM